MTKNESSRYIDESNFKKIFECTIFRLENVFGIEKPKEEEVTLTSSDIFSMDFNDSTALENAADFLKSSGEDPKAKTGRYSSYIHTFSF